MTSLKKRILFGVLFAGTVLSYGGVSAQNLAPPTVPSATDPDAALKPFSSLSLGEKRVRYQSAAEAYLAKHPELKAGIDKIAEGNVKASFVGSDGVTQTVTLMGREWVLEQIGSAIVRNTDPHNREKILTDLYSALSAEQKSELKISSLDQLKAMPSSQAKTSIRNMEEVLSSGRVSFEPQNLASPPECADEAGYENGSDCMYQTESQCSPGSWDADGLIAKQSFPLEKHLTCVKHQGERGTCAVFAADGALELEVSKQYDEKVSLSEQHLYWYYKKRIEAEGDQDSDGGDPEEILEEAMNRGYEHQLESVWNYNPSWDRTTDTDGNYADSCVDYAGEFCTDTVHQGDTSSTSVETRFETAASRPLSSSPVKGEVWSVAIVKGDGYLNRGVTELMDMDDRDTSLELAAYYLDEGRPVIATLHANTSWMSNPSGNDGFMMVSSADAPAAGHAVVMVGYLGCGELYPGSSSGPGIYSHVSVGAQACLMATGGGYFIMKNSWGPTYGDQGYIYVPYSWAEEWVYHLTLLDEGLD